MPGKILIACDSFKGCLSSREVADAVSRGLSSADAALVPLALADGGEGTATVLTRALGGVEVTAVVSDPLGRPIKASYGLCGDMAIIDTAAASGLTLLSSNELNPLLTSTYGTGELIADALRRGSRRVMVGLGGSATNDGGMGMLRALGAHFYAADGAELPGRGCDLERVERMDLSGLQSAEFTVLCDVTTPFTEAARVFGPQKGASLKVVEQLSAGLEHFASSCLAQTGHLMDTLPGSGAAGGLGGAFDAFLGAKLQSGIEAVLEAIGFDALLEGATLVITGEGRADAQTAQGKVAAGVLRHAQACGVPVVLLAGQICPCPELSALGFAQMIQITPPGMPLGEAMQKNVAGENIVRALQEIMC
ncbi:MAG: glycerate kinase [Bacteroidales bacterium]|nr:glycerate kinase [Bacteroidales bacterium]